MKNESTALDGKLDDEERMLLTPVGAGQLGHTSGGLVRIGRKAGRLGGQWLAGGRLAGRGDPQSAQVMSH